MNEFLFLTFPEFLKLLVRLGLAAGAVGFGYSLGQMLGLRFWESFRHRGVSDGEA